MEQKKIMLIAGIILWLLIVGGGVTFVLGAAKVSDNKRKSDYGYGIEDETESAIEHDTALVREK
jgi:hypothetical protein